MNTGGVTTEQASAVIRLIEEFDRVLGFMAKPRDSVPAAALRLLELRQQARQGKNWAEADRVRNELVAMGWVIQDTPQGPKLKRK